MPNWRLTTESYVWQTPGLDATKQVAVRDRNLASLDRKITYCVNRPQESVQFQRVEGWTTGQIIARMCERGLDRTRIDRDLSVSEYDDPSSS